MITIEPLYGINPDPNPNIIFSLPNLCSNVKLEDFKVYKCSELLKGNLNKGVGNLLVALVIQYQEEKRNTKVGIQKDYQYYHGLGIYLRLNQLFDDSFAKHVFKGYAKKVSNNHNDVKEYNIVKIFSSIILVIILTSFICFEYGKFNKDKMYLKLIPVTYMRKNDVMKKEILSLSKKF